MSERLNRLTDAEKFGLEQQVNVTTLFAVELTDEKILEHSLRCVRRAMETIHTAAQDPKALMVETKGDGSPVTDIDRRCEDDTRSYLGKAFPGSGFSGEERDKLNSENGYEFIMDPVDGTSAMISNEIEKVGVNFAVRYYEDLILSIVGNPGTGEIAYALRDERTRHLSLSPYGNRLVGRTLPDRAKFDERGARVMTRFRQGDQPIDDVLQNLWDEGGVRHLVSPGGSPAWHLAEAAKGEYIYVHNWVRPSQLEDLTAKKLVENAGGKVVDIDGEPIELENHEGLFLAGVDTQALEQLRLKIRAKLPELNPKNGS